MLKPLLKLTLQIERVVDLVKSINSKTGCCEFNKTLKM
jgi:hypothetical protein